MGKKDNKYKNLKIRLEDIEGMINAWGLENGYERVTVSVPADMKAQTLNFLVNCDGKVATLAVFPAKGGVCTVSPNFGKEKEISVCIADYIAEHSGKMAESNPYKNGLSIDVTKEEFEALFGLLKEQEDVVIDEERQEDKKNWARLRNEKYGDSIVLSFYNTGKLVIQGKQRELFCLAVELVSDTHDLQKFVNAETKSAGLTVNGKDVLNDMKSSLGNVYEFLGTAHKAILSSAYIFFRTDIVVVDDEELKFDYSELFFPTARALEGYIFKLFVNNNVLHEGNENLGYYFRSEDDTEPLTLHSQYVAQIDNDIISNEINKLYKLYHRVRHQYAHAYENDMKTAIITDRKVADRYFREIIESISKSYDIIVSAKK